MNKTGDGTGDGWYLSSVEFSVSSGLVVNKSDIVLWAGDVSERSFTSKDVVCNAMPRVSMLAKRLSHCAEMLLLSYSPVSEGMVCP